MEDEQGTRASFSYRVPGLDWAAGVLNRWSADVKKKAVTGEFCDRLHVLEATSGFEPLNNGFADHCLTTWLRRLKVLHIYHEFYF